MYERIQGTGMFKHVDLGGGMSRRLEVFSIYDASMREVIHSAVGIDDAKYWLETEVKRERLSCPTGGCED